MDSNATIKGHPKLIESSRYAPNVSVTLPFEPKMSRKEEIETSLKNVVAKVERTLISGYPAEKALPVLHRLDEIIHNLNYNTHKKSIAIFISPIVEKVFYLDIPLEERVVIDETFVLRDLVCCKKSSVQYLVLLLSAQSSKTYLGNCTKFTLVKSNVPSEAQAYRRDLPERVANFSDPQSEKETLIHKFVDHMDEGLAQILKAYPLPVFVLGAEKVLGYFNKITKNWKSIVGFIHGNYEESTESEIHELIRPYVSDWRKIKQQDAIHQVERAMNEHKLACGIRDVLTAAEHKNGRFLVLERDFVSPASESSEKHQLIIGSYNTGKPFYIKDVVDEVIENVLQHGGDVEFVDAGALKDYCNIALVKYF